MIEELFPNIPEKNIKIALLLMTIVMTLTIIICTFILFNTNIDVMNNPCDYCDCTRLFVGGINGRI